MKPFEFPHTTSPREKSTSARLQEDSFVVETHKIREDFMQTASQFSEEYTKAKWRILELEAKSGEWTDAESDEYEATEKKIRELLQALRDGQEQIEEALYQRFAKKYSERNNEPPTLH